MIPVKSIICSSHNSLYNIHRLNSLLGVVIILRKKKCILWTFKHEAANRFHFFFSPNASLFSKERKPNWKSSRDYERFCTSIPTIYLTLGEVPHCQSLILSQGLAFILVRVRGGWESVQFSDHCLISTPIFLLQVLMGKEGKWLPYASPHLFQMQKETHTYSSLYSFTQMSIIGSGFLRFDLEPNYAWRRPKCKYNMLIT